MHHRYIETLTRIVVQSEDHHVWVPIADSRSEIMVLRAHLAEADVDISSAARPRS